MSPRLNAQKQTFKLTLIKLRVKLQVKLLFSDSKTMDKLVNYTCKSFINIESVCQINLIRRCSQMSPATIGPGYEKPLQRVAWRVPNFTLI